MKYWYVWAISAAIVGLGTTIHLEQGSHGMVVTGVGLTEAAAAPRHQARRVSRRTARRTTRRVNYRTSVAGCPLRSGYYYCGGVYYRRAVQDGRTVYVVVNP